METQVQISNTTDTQIKEFNPFPDGYCDLVRLGKLDQYKKIGVFSSEVLKQRMSEGWYACNLQFIKQDGWLALAKNFPPFSEMSHEKFTELVNSTVYDCPLSILAPKFYGSIPIMILSKNEIKRDNSTFENYLINYSCDPKINLEMMVTKITTVLNGHGYCDYFLPSDGSGEWILLEIEVNQDTRLIIRTWDWYNK